MATPRRVAVVVGSLRKDSLNRKMAKALAAIAPPSLSLEIVEIGELPLYNQDDDADPPAASVAFKEKIAGADAVLFVTPEYNRSVPGRAEERDRRRLAPVRQERVGRQAGGGDHASRPGAIGGFGANHHLRQSLVSRHARAQPRPTSAAGAIGDVGANDHLRQSLVFLDMPVLQQRPRPLARLGRPSLLGGLRRS